LRFVLCAARILCGEDRYRGQSFEHGRQWVEGRLHQLAELSSVSLWAYAVTSNRLRVMVAQGYLVSPSSAAH
jgi:hypothetical protein